MRKIITILTVLIIASCFISAQRTVTPVENKPASIQTIEGKQAAERLLKKKINPSLVFGDSIIDAEKLEEKKDTVKKSSMVYPLLFDLTIGANIWDPIMRAFGQSYGGADFAAELSLHNRFIPVVEVGFGMANDTPDGMNFTYKSPLSVYGKIGASYNFLYNKTPDYQFLAGFRIGFTTFKYEITDVHVSSGYWGENATFNILDQSSNATWGEIVLGMKIKIISNFSMGWSLRYRIMFSYKKNENSEPWYIPGFGARNGSIGASYSLYYTFPFKNKNKEADKKATDVINSLGHPTAPSDSIP